MKNAFYTNGKIYLVKLEKTHDLYQNIVLI